MFLRCLALWMVTAAVAAPSTKLALLPLRAGSGVSEADAEAATREAVRGLVAVGWTASLLRPAEGDSRVGDLPVGVLGPKIAAATGAEVVVCGALLAHGPTPGTQLASLAAWAETAHQVLLLGPLSTSDKSSPSALGQALSSHLDRALRDGLAVAAKVIEVGQADPVVVCLRLASPLPPARSGYLLEDQPAPILSDATGEQFAGQATDGLPAVLLRSEQGSAWFELRGDEAAPAAGQQVRVRAWGDGLSDTAGPGVVVTSYPRGAVVTLGGVVHGVTPLWLPLPLEGSPEVQLAAPGRLPYRARVGVAERAAGLLAVTLAEPPPPGGAAPRAGFTVRVESEPSGAELKVDGQPRGTTPLDLPNVVGRPVLALSLEGYRDWEAQLTTSGPLTLKAELLSLSGALQVVSTPVGARVVVDGREMGTTPLRLPRVAVGTHDVSLVGGRWEGSARQVAVEPGQTALVRFGAGPEPLTSEGTPAPLLSPQLFANELRPAVDRIIWERKVTVLAADGREHRMHLAVAQREGGTLVSVTLSPETSYQTVAAEDGYQIAYPALLLDSPRSWTIDRVPGLTGIDLLPRADAPGIAVVLKLKPKVAAAVHESSTLERVRVLLGPAATPAVQH